jgi:hypothetical protein
MTSEQPSFSGRVQQTIARAPARNRVAVAFAFAVAMLLALSASVPFMKSLVVGEEGIFAYMAVDNGRPWQGGFFDVFFNSGRLDGKEVISTSGAHPSPPYLFVRHGLRHVTTAITSVAGFGSFDSWSVIRKSAVARLPFFLLYCVSFLTLAVLGAYVLQRSLLAALPVFAVIVWLGSMPLSVGGAVSPMYDGNVGVFLVAASALCLWAASRTSERRPYRLWMLGAGFIAALGKNEWSITFAAAILGAVVLRWLWFRFFAFDTADNDLPSGGPLALLAGLILGTLVNVATGPNEFWLGLKLIPQVAELTKNTTYAEVIAQRWRWIWPLFVLTPLAGVLILVNARKLAGREFPLLVLGLWGGATVCAFMLSKWIGHGFPRYFCPGSFALGAFVVAMLRHPLPRIANVALVAAMLVLIGANVSHLHEKYLAKVSVAEMPGLVLPVQEETYRTRYERFLATRQPQLGDVAMAYLYPDMDMMTGVVTLEELRETLKQIEDDRRKAASPK